MKQTTYTYHINYELEGVEWMSTEVKAITVNTDMSAKELNYLIKNEFLNELYEEENIPAEELVTFEVTYYV